MNVLNKLKKKARFDMKDFKLGTLLYWCFISFFIGIYFAIAIFQNHRIGSIYTKPFNEGYTTAICSRVLDGHMGLSYRNEQATCFYSHDGHQKAYQYRAPTNNSH